VSGIGRLLVGDWSATWSLAGHGVRILILVVVVITYSYDGKRLGRLLVDYVVGFHGVEHTPDFTPCDPELFCEIPHAASELSSLNFHPTKELLHGVRLLHKSDK